eukprot:COSAG02_NODE_50557_length_319_cov_6.650000_1_plen_87_part_01
MKRITNHQTSKYDIHSDRLAGVSTAPGHFDSWAAPACTRARRPARAPACACIASYSVDQSRQVLNAAKMVSLKAQLLRTRNRESTYG